MNILEGLKFELEMRKGNNEDIAKLPEIIAHIEQLEAEVKFCHRYILHLQDWWNEIRNFLSWLKITPETEEMEEEIDLNSLDEKEAKNLQKVTEDFAMNNFQDWYSKINKVHNINNLDEYENFKDNIPFGE